MKFIHTKVHWCTIILEQGGNFPELFLQSVEHWIVQNPLVLKNSFKWNLEAKLSSGRTSSHQTLYNAVRLKRTWKRVSTALEFSHFTPLHLILCVPLGDVWPGCNCSGTNAHPMQLSLHCFGVNLLCSSSIIESDIPLYGWVDAVPDHFHLVLNLWRQMI